MTSPALLIHVGYHKTATTWLQAQFFRSHHGFRKVLDHAEVFDLITRPHGLTFDPLVARQEVQNRLARLEAGIVPVISSEILSGNPFFGGRESDVFADRLHRIWPEARILITIRSQMKILPSVYMQYLQRGGTLPHSRFFTEESELGYTWFSPLHFEYDRLLEKYQNLYGPENVYLMQQESLACDPERACADLARFCGAENFDGLVEGATRSRGTSYPEYSAWALRRINHFQSSVLNRNPVIRLGENPDGLYRLTGYVMRTSGMKKLFRERRPVSRWVKEHMSGRFTKSNSRLRELTPHRLNLEAYT